MSFPRLSARTRRFTLGEPRTFSVSPDGATVLFLRAIAGDDPRTALWAIDAATGAERMLVDPTGAGDGALSDAEKARRERARETASGVVAYSCDRWLHKALALLGGHAVLVDVATGNATDVQLPSGAFDARLDPSGQRIGFNLGTDFAVLDLGTGQSSTLASGDGDVFWGRAEFVAAEEMDRMRGFWFSPSGETILVARVDESPVASWWISSPVDPSRSPHQVRYPASGTPNADVSLWRIGLDGAASEIPWNHNEFEYLVDVDWSAEPPLVVLQSRDQKHLRIAAIESDELRTIADDHDEVWVELTPGSPTRVGGRIARVVVVDGRRAIRLDDVVVTPPSLHVRGIAGTDGESVTFTAFGEDPAAVEVWRWSPAEGVVQLVGGGVAAAVVGGPTTVVVRSDLDHTGNQVMVTSAAGDFAIASHSIDPGFVPAVRLLGGHGADPSLGVLMPRNHEAGQRIPVLMDPYGGPHGARVLRSRRSWLEPQWWADQGFAVVVADGRGMPGRDVPWEQAVSGDLATAVLEDQVRALEIAAEVEPDLDVSRVGIRGWSFGGYLAALAVLRRPDIFHAAVAGAPVTDWRLYDTHYTERYLGTDATASSYDVSSLLPLAPSLSRPLLLVHGLADDNVVAAHTLQLSQRLVEAGRPHTVLPLSGITHMTPQESVAENLLLLQLDWLRLALDLS